MAQENDVVLVYLEDQPLTFARIESILPDMKKDWYHVKILILQVPLQVATWILRDIYINGEEFTMGGKRMRMEPVVCPDLPEAADEDQEKESEKPKGDPDSKIISLADRLKKRR